MPIPSPTIDSFELARSGRQLSGEVAIAQLRRLADFVASADGDLSYRIEGLIDAEGCPAADLHFDGQVQLSCPRCSSPVAFRIERVAILRYYATTEELI